MHLQVVLSMNILGEQLMYDVHVQMLCTDATLVHKTCEVELNQTL